MVVRMIFYRFFYLGRISCRYYFLSFFTRKIIVIYDENKYKSVKQNILMDNIPIFTFVRKKTSSNVRYFHLTLEEVLLSFTFMIPSPYRHLPIQYFSRIETAHHKSVLLHYYCYHRQEKWYQIFSTKHP